MRAGWGVAGAVIVVLRGCQNLSKLGENLAILGSFCQFLAAFSGLVIWETGFRSSDSGFAAFEPVAGAGAPSTVVPLAEAEARYETRRPRRRDWRNSSCWMAALSSREMWRSYSIMRAMSLSIGMVLE